MRIGIQTTDQLVLRDGRPFGDSGMFGGDSLLWPQPQTIAGMIRTAVGFSRSAWYFKDRANAEAIRKVGIEKLMMRRNKAGESQWLAPVPADLLFTGSRDNLRLNVLGYGELKDGCGTDISNGDWMIARTATKEKPAKEAPAFLNWDVFSGYLRDEALKEGSLNAIGLPPLPSDSRIHNSLQKGAGVTAEGGLYMNRGVYLREKGLHGSPLSIGVTVTGMEDGDRIPENAYLGGERKTVRLAAEEPAYPVCPDGFGNRQFLKLILMTHGDFGGWCPEWLMPDLDGDSIAWVKIPGSGIEVRLRSAAVAGWDGISGWDYVKKGPKATRKLVRPGAVYLIELKDPSQSGAAAAAFWGSSIAEDEESVKTGYGQVVVGTPEIR